MLFFFLRCGHKNLEQNLQMTFSFQTLLRICFVLAMSLGVLFVFNSQQFGGGVVGAQEPAAYGLLMDTAESPLAAKDFTVSTLKNKSLSLKKLRGKVVVLNFWATWCPPCVAELPSLERLERKMHGRAFALIALNAGEEPEKVKRFVRQHGLRLTIALDADGKITSEYGADRLPVTYVLDKQGRLIHRAIGERNWNSPSAVKFFQELAASAGQ